MGTVVVDAGVMIGVLDTGDMFHAPALRALRRCGQEGHALVLPVTVYAEALVRPLRERADAADVLDGFLEALGARVHPADQRIGRETARLRARHGGRLRLPDALVVATARVLDAEELLTTDGGWPALDVPVTVMRT